ncbi:hypothetical protein MTBBW1_60005 [Desulfamplus magnetovallimortis]|uniref:Uncharacterized protein n=1 Tax=Desulfamplus magnetovallimortis TaxID=1246637 RepID=A0A1W1HI61_9BACT|nr:hypothetical protein MTBBW1_60005 [Desulfamplus magnetovallimortis]
MMILILSWYQIERKHNNSIHAGFQKRRGFRCATATPLLEAGDARRYVSDKKKGWTMSWRTGTEMFYEILPIIRNHIQDDETRNDFLTD